MNALYRRITELSEKYLPLAEELLKEAIRIPADYVDKPINQGGDPDCGLSNHEGPRLEYLKKTYCRNKSGSIRRRCLVR